MPAQPLLLSEIIIGNPQIDSFYDLLVAVRRRAEVRDRIFLDMDLKPDFADTPRNWAFQLEDAFTGGAR